ncbi:LysR substrate-binding domain-containing protein [Vibrio salinus]|uniref:LysR substrate-binding domain-containing protein n=1 Tax=Vibrio salinus TaxID=2899784 RepID=UPI001E28265B|nr:LysR substrate-binding domain-containing protein [Vibrio salinus]MCE0493872.1 LysR substrate-binding domain-containing protein [Vibrio salinus]
MDIKQLRYFVCVAEELHFGKAAERLHIAQPALSIQIKNMENRLGGKLFIRNKRNVILTDAGKCILAESRNLINNMDALVHYSEKLFRGLAGHINISYSGLAAYTGVMGKIIGHFREQYPEVTIGLEEHDPYEQLQGLTSQKTHIAFMTTMGKKIPNDFSSIFLTSSPLTLLFPQNHPLLNEKKLNYKDLQQESFVIYASQQDHHATAVIEEVCGFQPAISHRTSTALLVPSLVSAGLGIAVIPEAFENIARDAGTVTRPLLDSKEMDISLIYPNSLQSEVVSRFINVVNNSIETKCF